MKVPLKKWLKFPNDKYPQELTTLRLYMPIYANAFMYNKGGQDEESSFLNGSNLIGYEDSIAAALVRKGMPEEAERGLMHWYRKNDTVNRKVRSVVFTVESREQQLWGVAECRVAGRLNPEELAALKDYISGQASDGWGEGFEQCEIQTSDAGLHVHLWSGENWSIKTEQERFPPKATKESLDAQMPF